MGKVIILIIVATVLLFSGCSSSVVPDVSEFDNGPVSDVINGKAVPYEPADVGPILLPVPEVPLAYYEKLDPVVTAPDSPLDTLVLLSVQAVKADLAAHLGVPVDVIILVSHKEVVWPDGSLGCPQPGMVYTAALVNGSLTVLEVDGVKYSYHAGGARGPFLCLLKSFNLQPSLFEDLLEGTVQSLDADFTVKEILPNL